MSSAGGTEEYVVLRTEQIYRIQALHTLVGVIIAGFFTSGVVILGWSFGTTATSRRRCCSGRLLSYWAWS